ncbi:uncharacterized protein FA14DRAFT_61536 [Meira miltonrushii]|uniref:Uncharacterized protein n=1 Tax=Meira miltonrushii TaxID=1280837 RepID=A0A316VA93_9BASI|nr:uncharacterized protein FA14DRAFT_61536 [Meira miltonrushii]PWN33371.1 hypothetical protein FA14DRAFT_61536 [Meira miltonrushii]
MTRFIIFGLLEDWFHFLDRDRQLPFFLFFFISYTAIIAKGFPIRRFNRTKSYLLKWQAYTKAGILSSFQQASEHNKGDSGC